MTRLPARVLVLSRNDYLLARSYAPELLTDPELQVIAIPARPQEEADPIYQLLKGRLRAGTLLIRNIWRPGEYVEATEAYEELSLQKFLLFADVCQRLGATGLEVTQIREAAQDGRQSGQANLSLVTSKWTGSFSNDTTDKMAGRLQAHWTWPGSPPDIEAAVALAEESGLTADRILMGWIGQRAYPANPLSENHLELDLSTEALREVQAAAEVQLLALKLGPSFKADLTVMKKQTSSVRLVLTVRFTQTPIPGIP